MDLITKGFAIQKSAVVLLARIVDAAGVPILRANVATIDLHVYDLTDDSLVVPTAGGGGYTGTALVVADVVTDAPAADVRFPYDDPPNLIVNLHGSFFPIGKRTYQPEVLFTMAAGHGDPFRAVWQIQTVQTFTP